MIQTHKRKDVRFALKHSSISLVDVRAYLGGIKQIGDSTIADSIPDRLVHNAYRFELSGESMRKERGGRS